MTTIFDYDVFLSFASSDEEIVKPVWQELCLSGLRVFWSDAALKRELGNSWVEIIESSLDKSRHMLLFCSPAAMGSVWVKREYRAFMDHCYRPGVRRLIPILTQGYKVNELPLFLRELEAKQLTELSSLKEIIPVLGGVNIEDLKRENESLRQNVESLQLDRLLLERELNKLKTRLRRNKASDKPPAQQDVCEAKAEGVTDTPPVATKSARAEELEAFDFLGLSPDASSHEILRRYESAKNEYEALLPNCPKMVREVCERRLEGLEHAFQLVYYEKREEEGRKVKGAYESLQLPEETAWPVVMSRYKELKTACLKAAQCFDPFIKEAATKELQNIEDAVLVLTAKGAAADGGARPTGFLVDVIMPHMGEQITEGTVTRWLKKEGELVERDEPLFEISTDKVDAEIPAPAAGVLSRIIAYEGETVPVNTVVAQIEEKTTVYPDAAHINNLG